jgi:hypothetical protein
MYRWRYLVGLAVVVVALASGPVPAESKTPTTTPVLESCVGIKQQVKPSNVVLICGDGSQQIVGVKWTSWGLKTAFGSGTFISRNFSNTYPRPSDFDDPAILEASGTQRFGGRSLFGALTVVYIQPSTGEVQIGHFRPFVPCGVSQLQRLDNCSVANDMQTNDFGDP